MTLCALSFDKQKKQAAEMFTHFKIIFRLNLTVESFLMNMYGNRVVFIV